MEVLPTVHTEQGLALQARAGSISMRDVQEVNNRTPPRNSITHTVQAYTILRCFYVIVFSRHRVLKNTGNFLDPRSFATQARSPMRANPAPLMRQLQGRGLQPPHD